MPHFLDFLSAETKARLTPAMLIQIEQQEALAEQAREMRPIKDPTDPRDFTAPYIYRPYPAMRYHFETGQQRIIQSVKEEHKDWGKTPPSLAQEEIELVTKK